LAAIELRQSLDGAFDAIFWVESNYGWEGRLGCGPAGDCRDAGSVSVVACGT